MVLHFYVNDMQALKICPHCGCVFTYDFDSDAYYDRGLDHLAVLCPDCDTSIVTDQSAASDKNYILKKGD